MKLDLFSNLSQVSKNNNIVQNFIKELNEFMKGNNVKNKENILENDETPILQQVQNQRKTSIAYQNEMKNRQREVLENYANETMSQGIMYFVSKKSLKNSDEYNVYKIENGKSKAIKLNEKDLPEQVGVNSVFREKSGRYVLDEVATEEIREQITKMANKLLDEQDKKLNDYRKEGHLYMITEEINDRRFLLDLTDKPDYEIEEVDFPKELLNEAKAGTVFIYSNGEYKYYSHDGFERLEQ